MTKQVIVVRKDLKMRKGKMAAQVAHAAMAFLTRSSTRTKVEQEWLDDSFTKVVVGVEDEQALLNLIQEAQQVGVSVFPIIDNGTTEFHGVRTLTCAAFGPDYPVNLDPITGDLVLL